ncbi:magnesium transporter CorA [Mucilaginibacter limnophilus]|uniref:Magnesium transporter CorA n=1 Tax=Mucilaginibacter limnophilus TaxID=1932778 RepID=A0A3S2Y4U9_9SPHI|nr:CorA family divalent cation transporter [Mucilaginibacter limnophilus]RVU02058.1 magnesium transporter CorA [Mucilaginibacter limnophilus]
MLKQIATKKDNGFDWIDITDPHHDEIHETAEKYHLHEALLEDSLQADHLPKYESMENYVFMIFRIHTDIKTLQADTVQQLTHKVAIFYSKEFIITIHRKPHAFIDTLAEEVKHGKCSSSFHLLNIIIKQCLNTYEEPSVKLGRELEYYEEQIFLRSRKTPLLKGMYFLKRKVDLIRRMFILSFDIVDNIDAEEGDVGTRDMRDLYVRLQNIYDALSENINHLLSLYFNVSAQRTNETVRILTVFSVFFMPLTFIVGIYGMNFKFMPELDSHWGYPGVLGLMVVITILIYFWFRRKGWL